MTLQSFKRKLKMAYYSREIKQIALVYFFGIAALAALIGIGYLFFIDKSAVPKIDVKLSDVKSNEDWYVVLFVIGLLLLLVFYIVYAFFFYPKKHRKDLQRINHFISALEKGEKITSYDIYPLQDHETNWLYQLWGIRYISFDLTDKNFEQLGAEEMFLVPTSCDEIIKQYYNPYGNEKNIEDTWKELGK